MGEEEDVVVASSSWWEEEEELDELDEALVVERVSSLSPSIVEEPRDGLGGWVVVGVSESGVVEGESSKEGIGGCWPLLWGGIALSFGKVRAFWCSVLG